MKQNKNNYSPSEAKRNRAHSAKATRANGSLLVPCPSEALSEGGSTHRPNNNSSLVIQNLHAETADGKKILQGVSVVVNQGEIHALMGPNGSGKSTLAQVLMGHPGYVITAGSITVDGTDIAALSPEQRAKHGLFLGFQYPVEVAGVNFGKFLRMAKNEQRAAGSKKISPIAFRKELVDRVQALGFQEDIASRSVNEGFSGGEKKKAEILQLAMLEPKLAVLDEPDSGLDVDALRYIAKAIKAIKQPLGLLLITHYQRILHYIKPDFVHILVDGKIVEEGKATLAQRIEKIGYTRYNESGSMKLEAGKTNNS